MERQVVFSDDKFAAEQGTSPDWRDILRVAADCSDRDGRRSKRVAWPAALVLPNWLGFSAATDIVLSNRLGANALDDIVRCKSRNFWVASSKRLAWLVHNGWSMRNNYTTLSLRGAN